MSKWILNAGTIRDAANGEVVLAVFAARSNADLVKIVEEHNAHEALVAVLRKVRPHVEASGFDPNGDVLSVLDMALDLAGVN